MSTPFFHLKSMTAYGRGASPFPYGTLTVEIQSVNRRHLEVNVNLPRLLIRFEMPIRKKISERIGRGMLNVFVGWRSSSQQSSVKVVPNLTLARGIRNAWEQIAYDLGLEAKIDLSLLHGEKDLLIFEEELPEDESVQKALEICLTEALDRLLEMKEKEGRALSLDLHERQKALSGYLAKIEQLAPEGSEKYRKKLEERLNEFLTGNGDQEERILREVALYAERLDISEEVVRLKSHLEQFILLLETPLTEVAETRGKTLDFLIQELNREINTIGSKASDAAISQWVIKAKSELEKMREQVQNIE